MLSAEVLTLIIYLMDRGFELYEMQNMTREQIKDDLVKQVIKFNAIQEQIQKEISAVTPTA
jgi:hypothetical protein